MEILRVKNDEIRHRQLRLFRGGSPHCIQEVGAHTYPVGECAGVRDRDCPSERRIGRSRTGIERPACGLSPAHIPQWTAWYQNQMSHGHGRNQLPSVCNYA